MKKLTITELNELVDRLNRCIEANTTEAVFYMTKEEATDLRDRLTNELDERVFLSEHGVQD